MKLLPAMVALSAALVCNAAPADKKLAVTRMVFAQSEDGPGLAANYQFLAGESVFFSCLVNGYSKSEKDEIFITYQIQAKDARGVLLQPEEKNKVEATLAPEDKDWKPKLRETIVIPPLADSGQYQVVVNVVDERNRATVEARATFEVKGRDVPVSDTLVARDFRFLRSEDDTKPLQVAAYRPGDSLWARFIMTGYKIGEKNQFDIEYGLAVLRADGSVAYTEPHAAAQKDAPFYPQRYQPGVLNLNFPKDQAAGEYTIVLTVRDNLGGQTYEARQKFSVE
ncbi:MAG TPA: hypothetical protein VKT81_23850 [Bryobacteraceae bacterium]|nr:hypothetical protein [Bryobacteraceae bacterium]